MANIKTPCFARDKNEWMVGNWDGDTDNRYRYMYAITSDETLESIIQKVSGKPIPEIGRFFEDNLTIELLCKHNYNTTNQLEVNWYLSNFNGCTKTNGDNGNYLLNSSDACPWIWIPLSKTKMLGKTGTKSVFVVYPDYEALYIAGMKKAAKSIESIISFGPPWGRVPKHQESDIKKDFQNKFDEEYFDETSFIYQVEGKNVLEGKLNVKSRRKFKEAIESIFTKQDKWKLDCALAVEVVRLGGIVNMMGNDFDKFCSSRLSIDIATNKPVFELKPWESTPVRFAKYYLRNNNNFDEWHVTDLIDNSVMKLTADLNDVLSAIPTGSRITWKYYSEDEKNLHFHNTLKVENDLYMLNYLSERKKLFSYNDLSNFIGTQNYYVDHIHITNNIIKEYREWKQK